MWSNELDDVPAPHPSRSRYVADHHKPVVPELSVLVAVLEVPQNGRFTILTVDRGNVRITFSFCILKEASLKLLKKVSVLLISEVRIIIAIKY